MAAIPDVVATVEETTGAYKHGFVTEIETDRAPKGLSEDTIRFISAKKEEPAWLLEWRLKAYRHWLTMNEPDWARLGYPADRLPGQLLLRGAQTGRMRTDPRASTRSRRNCWRPTRSSAFRSSEQEVLAGVRNVAVDAVFDSVSVATTFRERLARDGVVFCSISEAVKEHPDLVRKYLGTVVPFSDNFFATLNSAVFTDGSFCYIPKGVRCPMELSTYFRINASQTGQFERTLVIADEGSYVSYLEGCTAPQRDENQLHAAVVELVALDDAEIKYSTVQNWYPGDSERRGGIYNFVTKRGLPRRARQDLVDPGGDRFGHHLEVPQLHPQGRRQRRRVLLRRGHQQPPAGRYRHQDDACRPQHAQPRSSPRASRRAGRRTPIAAGCACTPWRDGARNYTQCDSLLIGDRCGAHTVPYIESKQPQRKLVEHEATTVARSPKTSSSTAVSAASPRRTR